MKKPIKSENPIIQKSYFLDFHSFSQQTNTIVATLLRNQKKPRKFENPKIQDIIS